MMISFSLRLLSRVEQRETEQRGDTPCLSQDHDNFSGLVMRWIPCDYMGLEGIVALLRMPRDTGAGPWQQPGGSCRAARRGDAGVPSADVLADPA
jgi:hypothetical protein